MSLAAACSWTLARCVVILLLAMPAAWLVRRLLLRLPRLQARWVWGLLLLVVVSPELLAGYSYASFGWSLGAWSPRVEVVYALLTVARCVPLGAVVWYFAPPPAETATARHCRELLVGVDGKGLKGWQGPKFGEWVRGPVLSALPAAGVIFLAAFQEFELASRLGAVSWTVWLFDAQAGGLELEESLRLAMLPLACEGVVILPLLALVGNQRVISSEESPPRLSGPMRCSAWLLVVIAAVAICVVPLGSLAVGVPEGLRQLTRDPILRWDLPKEVLQSMASAIVAGGIVYWLSGGLLAIRGRSRILIVSLLALPGLTGSLIVGLMILRVFQSGHFHRFYNTPVPLLLALIVSLLPRAILLRLLMQAAETREAWGLALLLRQSSDEHQQRAGARLGWELRGRGRYWGAVLLCHWAYWELPASALLAPTGMVPAPVRLYNLMHYNHGAVLSAMLAATIAIPILLFVLLARARQSLWRWCGR